MMSMLPLSRSEQFNLLAGGGGAERLSVRLTVVRFSV